MAFLKRLFGRRDSNDILVAFELHSVEVDPQEEAA